MTAMSASNAVPGFLPSTNGLHFPNAFPADDTYPVVSLPLIGDVVSGQAMNGICGGFVYTALDLFRHSPRLQPPADDTVPEPGSPLYRYLTRRFVDSLGPSVFQNAAKAVDWTQAAGHDGGFLQLTMSLAKRMVVTEWPAIRADIDAGRPSPLYLIAARQCALGDVGAITAALGHSHQVLAYAYDLGDDRGLALHVYDCNHPDRDDMTVALTLGASSADLPIDTSALDLPKPIRAVFHAAYAPADPSSIAHA